MMMYIYYYLQYLYKYVKLIPSSTQTINSIDKKLKEKKTSILSLFPKRKVLFFNELFQILHKLDDNITVNDTYYIKRNLNIRSTTLCFDDYLKFVNF